jgi:tetratricopeptide (TPR) repeat protein
VRAAVIAVGATLLIALAAATAAASTPAQALDKARTLFRGGQFSDAIPTLNYLLYPTPRLSQEDDLLEAHVLLAVCFFETGDRKTARLEFEEALFLDRNLALDTLLFSASAVEFFDDIKADLAEREARDAAERELALQNERLQRLLESMVLIETRPFWVNFIPFGAGQAQNGQPRKAILFASSQAITGGVSAAIWLYLVSEYGFPGKIVNPTSEEIDRIRLLQGIEIGTGAACIGLMIWGIVDAYVHYKPSVRREPDESLLPPELRQKTKPAAEPEARRPRLTPTATSRGAGLSLTWEF